MLKSMTAATNMEQSKHPGTRYNFLKSNFKKFLLTETASKHCIDQSWRILVSDAEKRREANPQIGTVPLTQDRVPSCTATTPLQPRLRLNVTFTADEKKHLAAQITGFNAYFV